MKSELIIYYGRGGAGIFISLIIIFTGILGLVLNYNINIIIAFFMIPLICLGAIYFIYSIIKKKIQLSYRKIEYYFGDWKRFEASWDDTTTIINGLNRKYHQKYIEIKSKNSKLVIESYSQFNKNKLNKIFLKVLEIQKQYPNIEIINDLE